MRKGVSILLLALGLAGCNTLEKFTAGALVATAVGAQSPSHEVRQIFYVGSFDPQGQVPPELYRIRVHGQASFISNVSFASGWVKAELIDSLGTTVSQDENTGAFQIKGDNADTSPGIKIGRRLMQFGPEGFREAPAGHRLVIVMGTDPGEYFNAMNQALGLVRRHVNNRNAGALTNDLLSEIIRVEAERRRLEELQQQLNGGGEDNA